MLENVVDFVFESQHLKQIKHEGVRLAGVQFPDSVAEHSLNAAQIGYLLAQMEGADANKVAAMLVRHDIAETRIGDIHKVGARYITNKKEIEKQVMEDQLDSIPGGEQIQELFADYESRSSLEGSIAKDADYLEQAFQAKIYVEQGYTDCQNWIDNVGRALQTDSAKSMRNEMITKTSSDRRKKTSLKKLSHS